MLPNRFYTLLVHAIHFHKTLPSFLQRILAIMSDESGVICPTCSRFVPYQVVKSNKNGNAGWMMAIVSVESMLGFTLTKQPNTQGIDQDERCELSEHKG